MPGSLFDEKSLFAIWRKSRREWSLPCINWFVVFATLILAIIYSCYADQKWLQGQILFIASTGLEVGLIVLGLLVAGFSFAATSGKSEMYIYMATHHEKPGGLSYWKYYFFPFVATFAELFLFCIICFFVRIFSPPQHFYQFFPYLSEVKPLIIPIVFCTLATYLAYLMMGLKSFLWNLYAFTTTFTMWHVNNSGQCSENHDSENLL